MEEIRQTARTVLSAAGTFGRLVAFTAFHMACGAKEFVESGFGVPFLITTGASASIAACAFAGHANLALNLVSKFYGKMECGTCNGWEALRCTDCKGTGKFQYLIVGSSGASSSDADTLPTKACSTCDGTGVIYCTECKGYAYKPGFSIDEVANTPTKAVKAYKKLDIVRETMLESMEDPATAAFHLFTRPELELGRPIDEDVKQEMWKNYNEWRRLRLDGEIEDDTPKLQVLVATDPTGMLENPAVVKDVSYYQTRKAIQKEVRAMQPPPRPYNWNVGVKYPLKDSDWSQEELKDPRKRDERDVLLKAQASILDKMLDVAWEDQWREEKIEELTRKQIESVVKKQSAPEPVKAKPAATPAAEAPKAEPQAKKKPAETSKEDKRKKERRERAEKMAKQAAEREEALKKSKKKS